MPEYPAVLVTMVEDAPRSLIVTALRRAGYRVQSESSVSGALGHDPRRIDLLVLKPKISGRDGAELVERFAESNPSIRALFVSGTYFELPLDGRSLFLAMPFSIQELRRVAAELTGEAAGRSARAVVLSHDQS